MNRRFLLSRSPAAAPALLAAVPTAGDEAPFEPTVTLDASRMTGADHRACIPWCEENGIDGSATYRLEIDYPTKRARLFQRARTPEGKMMPQEIEPYIVRLKTLPGWVRLPAEYRRREGQ